MQGFPHPPKENIHDGVVEILRNSSGIPSLAKALGEGNAGGW